MAKRRDQGEGSVFLRERDGKYIARLDLGWVDGKRKRVERTAATKREALDKLAEMKKAQEHGIDPASGKLTAEQHLNEWVERVKRTKAPGTWRIHEQAVRLRWIPAFGKKPLNKVTVSDVQAVLNRMADEGKSKNLIANNKVVLSAALSWAEAQGRVYRNVARLTEVPGGTPKRDAVWLTPEEAMKLLDLLKGDRFETLITLILSVGLRRGEACALKWKNLDFEEEWITVEGNLQQKIGGGWEVRAPKTDAAKRKIPLLPNLARLLKAHRAQQALEKRIAGDAWKDEGFVFPNGEGGPLSERTLSKHFKTVLRRAAFPPVRLHGLRHSCASILLAQGVEPKEIQEILGHTRIAITLDIYSHVLPEKKRSTLNRMDEMIGTAK